MNRAGGRRGPRGPLVLAATTLAAALPGCGGADPGAPGSGDIVRSDSAGIEMVEIPAAALEALPEWRIADEPVLSIGEAFGEEPYLFSGVSDGFVAPDGSTWIAEAGTSEIRVFDPEGTVVRRLGGRGEGPGEFGEIGFMRWMPEGEVLVFDPRLRRVTRLDGSGQVLGTAPWTGDGCRVDTGERPLRWLCAPVAFTSDGSLVVRMDRVPPAPPSEVAGGGAGSVFGIHRETGFELVDSVVRPVEFSGRAMFDGREFAFTGAQPFSPTGSFSVGGGGMVFGYPDRFEYRVREGDGRLTRIVRVGALNRPVTQDVVDEFLGLDGPDTRARATLIATMDEIGHAPTVPHYEELFRDAVGRTWVREFLTTVSGDVRVLVFDPEGAPLARMVIPWALFRWNVPMIQSLPPVVLHVDEDHFLVVEQDELGVDQVRRYAIVRGAE